MYWNYKMSDKIYVSFTIVYVVYYCVQNFAWAL